MSRPDEATQRKLADLARECDAAKWARHQADDKRQREEKKRERFRDHIALRDQLRGGL